MTNAMGVFFSALITARAVHSLTRGIISRGQIEWRVLPLVFYLDITYGADFQDSDEAMAIIHSVSALTHAHRRSQIACGIYLSIASMILHP